jgi:hypothetical protein
MLVIDRHKLTPSRPRLPGQLAAALSGAAS